MLAYLIASVCRWQNVDDKWFAGGLDVSSGEHERSEERHTQFEIAHLCSYGLARYFLKTNTTCTTLLLRYIAHTDDRQTRHAFERHCAGVLRECARSSEKHYWRGGSRLHLSNGKRISSAYSQAKALKTRQLQFQNERLIGVASSITPLDRLIELTIEYAGQRKVFGGCARERTVFIVRQPVISALCSAIKSCTIGWRSSRRRWRHCARFCTGLLVTFKALFCAHISCSSFSEANDG